MVTPVCEKISEDEAAVYDRQIRLWGLDSQNRLRNSSVLLIGLNGLGAEVAKNLMLSGLKSLVLMDDAVVTEMDGASQFLIPVDCLGQNRAEASLARCQQLNPMVEVEVDASNFQTKGDEYLAQFHLICIITDGFDERVVQLNEACHRLGVKFIFGACFGWFGFCFSDFNDHEFVEEISVRGNENGDGPPSAKRAKIDGDTDSKQLLKTTDQFVTIKEALRMDVKPEKGRAWKTAPSGYYLLQILRKFHQKFGRCPAKTSEEKDWAELDVMKGHLTGELSTAVAQQIDIPGFSAKCLFGVLSPVCAITGGILAQEVIKALSKKDRPLNNFFFYNGMDFSGTVGKFPIL